MRRLMAAFAIVAALLPTSHAQTSVDDGVDFEAPDYDEDAIVLPFACQRANSAQVAQVNAGLTKLQDFLTACAASTNGSRWCNELTRPNPASVDTFHCTYGTSQAHNLIHPDESTWTNAFLAVNLVEELEEKGIKTCLIYNWWRPEPYNKNVGGASGRHPYGTSVDVRFCSMDDMSKAHTLLCQWRKQGRLKALGYYGTTALHFGMADREGNTWGKSCP